MKNKTNGAFVIIAISALAVTGSLNLRAQTVSALITSQPADQLAPVGADATLSVSALHGCSYQWLRNGFEIPGQTNSSLVLQDVQIEDAGFYSCNVMSSPLAASLVTNSSTSASLMVFTPLDDLDVVVYAAPIVSSGSQGSCPGPYQGYVNYVKSPGWGWSPASGTTTYMATDNTRTDTKVEYVGGYGDVGCHKTSVTIPYPAMSPAYRFTIYFTNNVPSTNYPITLTGFNQ